MSTTVKRGYSPNDSKEFVGKSIDILLKAGRDLQYLLNQGYHIKGASNSGRLKQKIMELLGPFSFEVEADVINNVDTVLEKLDHVITSDAIILDKCVSWINLNAKIIEEINADYPYIDFDIKKR